MQNCCLYLLIGISLISCDSANDQEKAIASKKILKAYQEWVYLKVKKGQNWYESKWQAELDKRPNPLYIDNCKEGLPDDFHRIHFGDVNLDGKLDAIATIVPLPCHGGTASRFQEIELFFMSQNENYSTSEAFNDLISSIGLTGEVNAISEEGIITYTFKEHGENDAMCCPSVETKVKFKYQNGTFIKL